MPLKLTKSKSHSSRDSIHCTLGIQMESPPLVLLGPPEVSSGALASGILTLLVSNKTSVPVESFRLELIRETKNHHPPASHCADCAGEQEVMQNWNMAANSTFAPGAHNWPFSYLFPGHLSASINTRYVTQKYYLKATLTYALGSGLPLPSRPEVYIYPLELKRALLPGADIVHKRIFPPTKLVATLTMPATLSPRGVASIEIALTGFEQGDGTVWGLSKLSWRFEEHINYTVHPCPAHNTPERSRTFQEKKIINAKDMYQGWKSIDDQILIPITLNAAGYKEPTSDVDLYPPFQLQIKHFLVVEAIVNKRKNASPNGMGNARILRVKIQQPLTEPAGLGISWDEECPPVFESVGPAPPAYS
ncbi:endocytosis regulator [Schizosaccharomyces japonicus yFS275]|uniref:Endocytosis regulator n=1 Tax=Schizosaccharomyces japonicus (strain yFS275 / FY16936) TaxID=402676 RepID=B6K451_SCHJY|nr:endocytosis regulator [Schizosaccharomyces japonicus yFS275]EEB08258.1 endocytosis regulator [Schizosaccharomyces japonicus yFS275]